MTKEFLFGTPTVKVVRRKVGPNLVQKLHRIAPILNWCMGGIMEQLEDLEFENSPFPLSIILVLIVGDCQTSLNAKPSINGHSFSRFALSGRIYGKSIPPSPSSCLLYNLSSHQAAYFSHLKPCWPPLGSV